MTHFNNAAWPAVGKLAVILPRPAKYPSIHPLVAHTERTIQACVNLVVTDQEARESVSERLRTALTDERWRPTPGRSHTIEGVEKKRWQLQCIVDSIAKAEGIVDSAVEQTGECVEAASLRIKGVTVDLVRTLRSLDAWPDGLRYCETQVVACIQRAVTDIWHVTTGTAERMRAISSQVNNTRPLVGDGPAATAGSSDVPSPTKGLSGGVDRLVMKSPRLWNLVSDFTSRGGSIGYHETDGQDSEITINSRGHPVLLLEKGSGQSPEATVREIAWQLGRIDTPPADLSQKAEAGVAQTAWAAVVGSKVRSELLSAGGQDIRLAHPNDQHYLDVYEENSSDERTAYVFLYQAFLADDGKARMDSRDSWKAEIVPNALVLPQN